MLVQTLDLLVWLHSRPRFALLDVWHLSVASVFVQAAVSLALVRWQLATRLVPMRSAAAADQTG